MKKSDVYLRKIYYIGECKLYGDVDIDKFCICANCKHSITLFTNLGCRLFEKTNKHNHTCDHWELAE